MAHRRTDPSQPSLGDLIHAYRHYAVKATLTTCPSCLKRAEIVDRFTLPPTDGPVGLLGRIGTRFRFARTSERLRSGARDTRLGRRLSRKAEAVA
jgi:hypothetical protein